MKIDKPCPCCGSNRLDFVGHKKSIVLKNNPNEYRYWCCNECLYRFQGNPNTNFEMLYGEKYYKGHGADDLVDYAFELEFPSKTIRNYEFIGVRKIVESFYMQSNPDDREVKSLKWLDFGCGNGAFVNYLNTISPHEADGFDIGFAAHEGISSGIKIVELKELKAQSYDCITAIEVLEHIENPQKMLEQIFNLLKPGGLFFYTTGNSHPFMRNFLDWRYTDATDVHIGFFEPKTLNELFSKIGFDLSPNANYVGWNNIYKYKILKNLGVKRLGIISALFPSLTTFTKIVDWKFQLMAMPIAVKPSA